MISLHCPECGRTISIDEEPEEDFFLRFKENGCSEMGIAHDPVKDLYNADLALLIYKEFPTFSAALCEEAFNRYGDYYE